MSNITFQDGWGEARRDDGDGSRPPTLHVTFTNRNRDEVTLELSQAEITGFANWLIDQRARQFGDLDAPADPDAPSVGAPTATASVLVTVCQDGGMCVDCDVRRCACRCHRRGAAA